MTQSLTTQAATQSAISPYDGVSHFIDIVFPGDTNHHNTLFGGTALSHMDKVAFVAATRYGRRNFVTASCDRIDFNAPAEQGNIVDFKAQVCHVGSRSLRVQVDMFAEGLDSSDRILCTRGVFNMVSPDKEKAPLIPLNTLSSPDNTPCDNGDICNRIEMIFADQTNHYGTLFGGNALAMMGKSAFITATRYSRQVFVMAASQRTDFMAAADEGEIIDLSSRVKYVGRTSLVVEVTMHAEDLYSGNRRKCARSDFVMVAMNADKKPCPIVRA